jgi:protein-disulfide isomerase
MKSIRRIALAATIATLSLGGLTLAQKTHDQKVSRAQTKITQQQAEATALKAYPGGKIKETELEKEDGGLIYSVEFTDDAEVEIDANTGKVLEVEYPGHSDKDAQDIDTEDDD